MRHVLRHAFFIATLLGAALSALAATTAPVARLLYSDTARPAAEFYTKALGWEQAPVQADTTEITLSLPGGASVRTLALPAHLPGRVATRWIPVFGAGAELGDPATGSETTTLLQDEMGWVGLDPLGSPVGIAAPGRSADIGHEARPSVWPVLLTPFPDVALEFYSKQLGWTVRPDSRTPLFEGDFIWSRDGRNQAGLTYQAPGPSPAQRSSGWLLLFGVADLDEILKTSWRAGARILRSPSVDLIGGRVAVLADPAGAAFGLYELVPTPGPPAGKGQLQIRSTTP